MTTVASLIRARKGDQHAGYIFEGRTYTWDEVVSESAVRASILAELLSDDRPPHVGILLENTPDYLFWIGGAALVGACVVGINPTRRGSELERDIQHTDCQIIVSDQSGMTLIGGLQTGVDTNKVIDVDSAQHRDQLLQHRDATLPEHEPDENSILFLLFTSGSTSAPKAVVCTNQRMATASVRAGQIYGVTANEVCYCPMPLFHGNALMACWGPALAVGATLVLRRKFSASNFMSDIRAHQCTYFTYVGRTIAYILGQPISDEDRNNTLRLGFGTEASALDRERFLERFGCDLVEGYGSSESVVAIIRTPDTPANALGKERADMAGQVCIVDPDTTLPTSDQGRTIPLRGVVEKPDAAHAPSDLAVVGRYILGPKIFERLEQTPHGLNGEIQLTDAIHTLAQEQPVVARHFSGTRYDVGSPEGWLRANLHVALDHPIYGPVVRRAIAADNERLT